MNAPPGPQPGGEVAPPWGLAAAVRPLLRDTRTGDEQGAPRESVGCEHGGCLAGGGRGRSITGRLRERGPGIPFAFNNTTPASGSVEIEFAYAGPGDIPVGGD
jgi:hypothetical protein